MTDYCDVVADIPQGLSMGDDQHSPDSFSPMEETLSLPSGPQKDNWFVSTASDAAHMMNDSDALYEQYPQPLISYDSSPSSCEQSVIPATSDGFACSTPSPSPTGANIHFAMSNMMMPTTMRGCSSYYNTHEAHPNHADQYTNSHVYSREACMPYRIQSCYPIPPVDIQESTHSSPCTNKNNKHIISPLNSVTYKNHSLSDQSNSQETYHPEKRNPGNKKHPCRKDKKRCSNCHTIKTPSWRRSIEPSTKGNLVCNACGLYEKTTKKKRLLLTQSDGNIKVVRKRDFRAFRCRNCGSEDGARWKKLAHSSSKDDIVICERCSHSHSRR